MPAEAQPDFWASFFDNILKLFLVVAPTIVSSISAYRITKYNASGPARNAILEKQLLNVFAPIQQIYYFVFPQNPEEARFKIQEIIDENIAIIPSIMIDTWIVEFNPRSKKEKQQNHLIDTIKEGVLVDFFYIEEPKSGFFYLNQTYFEFSQQKLGYARKRIDKKRKKIIRRTFTSNDIITNISFSVTLCSLMSMLSIFTLIGLEKPNLFPHYNIIVSVIVVICIFLLVAFLFVLFSRKNK